MAIDEWNRTNLGEQVNLLTGFPFKSAEYTEDADGIPLVRGDNVVQSAFRWDDVKTWSRGQIENLSDYFLNPGDVVLAMDRPWIEAGLKYAYVTEHDVPCILVQRVSRLRAKNTLDQRFLRYVIGSPEFTNYIIGVQTGTAVPHISGDQIKQYQFLLPLLPEQSVIAGILGELDDKIELNRRMNRTLESMARAVFRQWFVENEEVGKWRVAQIGDIADVIDCLHSKKPERQDFGKPFLQLSNILDNGLLDTTDIYFITKEDYDQWISRIEASPGDCVITNVGRVGAIAQIPEGFKAALGRNMTAILCKNEYPYPTFIIECLLSDTMRQEINIKTDTGTILDALNVKNIPLLQFALPPHNKLKEFEKTVRPIRAKMEQNLKESHTLASLRDSLLPKLMRGEVRMKDAEKEL